MPAGAYDIEQVSAAGVLRITNEATNATVMVLGSPIGSGLAAHPGKVTFTAVAGKYSLSQVYLPSGESFSLPSHATTR